MELVIFEEVTDSRTGGENTQHETTALRRDRSKEILNKRKYLR
jgi:hypothetical protein